MSCLVVDRFSTLVSPSFWLVGWSLAIARRVLLLAQIVAHLGGAIMAGDKNGARFE